MSLRRRAKSDRCCARRRATRGGAYWGVSRACVSCSGLRLATLCRGGTVILTPQVPCPRPRARGSHLPNINPQSPTSADHLEPATAGGFVKMLPVGDEVQDSSAAQPKTLGKYGSEDAAARGPAHTAAVTACAASPDGAVLVTAGEDGTVLVWSCKDWAVSHECAHGSLVTSIAFHMPDCVYFSVAGGPLPGGDGDFSAPARGLSEAGSRPGTKGGTGTRPGTRGSSKPHRLAAYSVDICVLDNYTRGLATCLLLPLVPSPSPPFLLSRPPPPPPLSPPSPSLLSCARLNREAGPYFSEACSIAGRRPTSTPSTRTTS